MPESPNSGLIFSRQQEMQVLSLVARVWIDPKKPKLHSSYLLTWPSMSRAGPSETQNIAVGSFALQDAWTQQHVQILRTWHVQHKSNDVIAKKKEKRQLTINALQHSLNAHRACLEAHHTPELDPLD